MPSRLALVMGALVLAFGVLGLVRFSGFTGAYLPELAWRWSASHEERLASGTTGRAGRLRFEDSGAEWPGFRGPRRDGTVQGLTAALDWQASPPRELWRIDVGPAWSSFAYAAGRLFTQEQRGEQEVISSYDPENGELIWQVGHSARFSEVVSGAGPRATPAFADGKVFALGATGLLSALDANSGELIWQRDLVAEVKAFLPVWGFSGSPLVAGDAVIVYAGGEDDNGLLAYDAASGEVVWRIASQGMNFSSAQLVRLGDQELVLFADGTGLMALEPSNGSVAWRFKPSEWGGPPIVQAQQIGANDVVVPLGDGTGVARIQATFQDGEWSVRELWSSRGLKPSFNDFVFHDGFLYGFDQNIFACVDAETGERQWKRGRYGFGQVVLLADSSQMILTAEKGDVVLLAADPDQHTELGRIPVLGGKTWNHPAVVGDRLIVRNGRQAVSLALADSVVALR